MQKDFHFNLTYCLARRVGIESGEALKLAWADQFTDDMVGPGLHGIQTQSAILGNWKEKQIQLTCLAAFHFLPGDDKNFWLVTEDSTKARSLLAQAQNVFELGIALHTFQDTFSHQDWTGFEEKFNACPKYGGIFTPNISHTDMLLIPDIVNIEWTDPRTGERIDNRARALRAAEQTYRHLVRFYGKAPNVSWDDLDEDILKIITKNTGNPSADYDRRKQDFMKLAGDDIRYSKITKDMQQKYIENFNAAARKQLGRVMLAL